jgi:DNA-binding SARP family transcriptional activator
LDVRPRELSFRILGPIEVLDAEDRRPLGGKMVLALLASLLIHARTVRTADQLIDDLWTRPPRTACASLHNHVSALRRVLGAEILKTIGTGYVLEIQDDQIDALRFERLLVRSRTESSTTRVETLEHALRLWRGSPLIDVRYEDFAQSEITRLEELRVRATEELLSAKLDLGASDDVVPELQRLVHRYPYRERLRMHLMLALHRSGRSVEAIASYVDFQRMSLGSAGVEPGADLCQLVRDIRALAPVLVPLGRTYDELKPT